jgi:deoxyribonuclease IV
MKIGVKTYDNMDFLEYFKDKCDFFEVMAIETIDYSFLKNFSKPIVIHAQHERFLINNADKLKETKNLASSDFARKLADNTKSKKIILHPGRIENNNCSEENSINFFKNIKDKRILIENCPNRKNFLLSTPLKAKEFLKQTDKGFCLDINHAIETAIYEKIDYLDVLKAFIKLRPVHYHLCGQRIETGETHLAFEDGSDIDLDEIFKLIPKNAEITLEVSTDIKKTENDLNLIKKYIKIKN